MQFYPDASRIEWLSTDGLIADNIIKLTPLFYMAASG
jgi:hypothetical protein